MQGFFLSLALFIGFLRVMCADDGFLMTLYSTLNPQSISELFAFYALYPKTPEGQQALADAWKLLYKHRDEIRDFDAPLHLPEMEIEGLISLVNQEPFEKLKPLSEAELERMERISAHLSNRNLKGHLIWKKEALSNLAPEEIDLGRFLLLMQFENDRSKIRHYEAILDLIALQILAYLPKGASDLEKIEAINHFIFYEKGFRFPPHSLSVKEIDTYTFLPLVLDSRLGVCLGVSIVYLCIAERLDLPLEIVTPPGHIFLRYRNGAQSINIETTARGIHLPDERYLGIFNDILEQRNKKEVVGLALMNQAFVFWQKGAYEITAALYEKALAFLPNDLFLKMLLGYQYLFIGKMKQGKALLNEIKEALLRSSLSHKTMPEDFLNQKVNREGIEVVFLQVDETRESILKKQKALQKVLKRFPHFREGLLQLAIIYLQLEREGEALEVLKSYHAIDRTSPIVEYYLATLCMDRFLYQEAWDHLALAEALTKNQPHSSLALKRLRRALHMHYPDPQDIP